MNSNDHILDVRVNNIAFSESMFRKIAVVWRMIAQAEMWHHEIYHELAERITEGSVFKKKGKIK